MDKQTQNLLTTSQAAKLLGVSIDTVRRREQDGTLRSTRSASGARLFERGELERYKSSRPLTVTQAAKELGIHPAKLRRLEKNGHSAAEKGRGGRRLYSAEALQRIKSEALNPKSETSTKPEIRNLLERELVDQHGALGIDQALPVHAPGQVIEPNSNIQTPPQPVAEAPVQEVSKPNPALNPLPSSLPGGDPLSDLEIADPAIFAQQEAAGPQRIPYDLGFFARYKSAWLSAAFVGLTGLVMIGGWVGFTRLSRSGPASVQSTPISSLPLAKLNTIEKIQVSDPQSLRINTQVLANQGLQVNGAVVLSDIQDCDTLDTDADGTLQCGTDDTATGVIGADGADGTDGADGAQGPQGPEGPAPNLVQGSVVFQGASGLAEDNANFFYDDTNNRLGLGTNSPSAALHVVGNARITGLVSCDTVDTDASGNLVCGTDAGAGGGASTAEPYVTVGNVAGLTAERAITAGTNVSLADGGANSTLTLNVVDNPTFSGLITANGGLTVQTGDTFTFNGDAFTDLTGTGLTISGGALQTTLGTSIQDGEVDNDLTISSSGSVDWLALTNYPTACSAGSAVSTLADVPTCTSFNTDTSITLQDAYDSDANGTDVTVALTTTDDSLIISNPAASGTDSAFLAQITNLAASDKTALLLNTVASGSVTAIDASDADFTNAINIGANNILTSGATIASAELDRLDGKDAALVDVNDAVNTAITGVGTITSGIWQGTAVGATFGGTGQAAVTTGDLLYGSAANTWSRLAVGSAGNCLVVSGGVPSWGSCAGAGSGSTLQAAYDNSTSPATISYTASDDSIVFSNPAASGSDSTFLFNLEQLAGNSKDGLLVTSAASGITDAIDVSDADIVNAINIGANNILTSGATIASTELDVLDGGISESEVTGEIEAVTAGAGLTGGGTADSVTLDVVSGNGGIVANANDITLTLQGSADALSSTTSSGSGLEILSGGLTMLQGCSDNQILKWNETTDVWACATDGTGTASNSFTTIDTPSGTDPTADTSTDTLQFLAGDTAITITGADDPESITIDVVQATLAGSGLGVSGDTLAVNVGNGVEINSDAVRVDEDASFTWLGQHTFTPSGANGHDINLDADSLLTIDQAFTGTTTANSTTLTATNSSTSGTQNLLYLDNAASTGTTESLLVIDNSDTDTAVTNAVEFINGGGGFTNLFNVAGTLISQGEFTVLDGGIQNSEVDDDLTISSAGSVDWTALTNYPAACAAGSAVSTLADVPTCTSFNTDTSITLQDAYDAGAAGDQTISLDSTQDSVVISNPSSSGTDSTFLQQITNLAASDKTALLLNTVASGSVTAIDASDADFTNAISVGANTISGTTAAIDFSNFDVASTGQLTFSSVGIDITTATNEDLVLLANGVGQIQLTDDVRVDGTMTFASTTDITTLTDEDLTLQAAGIGDIVFSLDSNSPVRLTNATDTDTDITTGTNQGLRVTAQGTGDIVFVTDADTTFAISNLVSCDTIDTDANGVLSCGTDDGGSGSTLQGAYDAGAAGDQTISLDSTQDSIIISNPASSGTDSAFLFQINQLAGNSKDGILIQGAASGIVDAIDASDADITNALNAGANFALFDGIRLFEGTTGTLTVEDTSGNDLIRVVDNGTTGNLVVTGDVLPNASPTAGSSSQTITSADTSATDVGERSSAAVAADGLPMVAYYDVTNTALKLLKCTNASCSTSTTQVVDGDTGCPTGCASGDSAGGYIGLALGNDGFPIIAYRDDTNSSLKLVDCGDATCSSGNTYTQVDGASGCPTGCDSAGSYGNWTSMAIGQDGNPFIAYMNDAASDNLEVVKCGNTACSSGNTYTAADPNGNTGQWTDVAIRTDGRPMVSYQDVGNTDVQIIDCPNAACSGTPTIRDVGNTGDNHGYYTSIAIGTDGLPIITHHETAAGGDLIASKCSNVSCSAFTATDVSSTGGSYTSVAIGTDGLPVISYINGALFIAKCGNESCSAGNTLTSVDSAGSTYTSISIPSSGGGHPFVAYHDETGGDLEVVRCADPACRESSGGAYTGGSSIGSIGSFFNNVYAAQFWGKQFQIANFDLAEEYRVTDTSIGAGDVVCLSPSGGFVVEKSSPSCKAVLGIVATKPGLTLGEWDDVDKSTLRPVALAGRVPTKVKGEVAIGDRLTPSETPGVAERHSGNGPVIGVAMEAYRGSGVGFVTVFVSNPVAGDSVQASVMNGSFESLNVSGSATIANLKVTGTLTVAELQVEGHIIGNEDTTGKVTVEAGETEIKFTFEDAYDDPPHVVVSPINAFALYRVEATKEDFTIYLRDPAAEDTDFNYQVQGRKPEP